MVEFRNLYCRSKRRARLEFSSDLAVGAFVTTWFTVATEDGATGDPLVVAALVVPGFANQLELAFDRDMAPGGLYLLTIASGLPAADASTLATTTQHFAALSPQQAPSETLSIKELHDLIFQEDIAHDPFKGHQLAPDGDLGVVGGPPNVKANLTRGVMSKGLPHRRNWGAGLEEDLDLPSPMLATTRGKLERQVRRDDRVLDCKVTANEGDDGVTYLNGDVQLIGRIQANLKEPLNAGK